MAAARTHVIARAASWPLVDIFWLVIESGTGRRQL